MNGATCNLQRVSAASKLMACLVAAAAIASVGCRTWNPHPFSSNEAVPAPIQVGASRDGARVWVATAREVRVVDPETGALVAARPLTEGPYRMVVAADGLRAFTATYTGALTALELRGRELLVTTRADATSKVQLEGIALSRDGAWLASAKSEGPVMLYANGDLSRPPTPLGLAPGRVRSIAFVDDGSLVVERDRAIELFAGPPFVPVGSREKHPGFTAITSAGEPLSANVPCDTPAWDPSGSVLACLGPALRLCDRERGCREIDLGPTLVDPQAITSAAPGFFVVGQGPLAALVTTDGAVRTFFVDGVVDRPSRGAK